MSGPYENLSFRSEECTVVAGLKDNQITGFWRPMVAVGEAKLLKYQIERLYSICPNIVYMDFLVDGELNAVSKFLLGKGYKARPYYTQIIDLTNHSKSDLRKSYRSLVNKQDGVVAGGIDDYRKLHTRKVCWEQQREIPHIGYFKRDAGVVFYYSGICAYYAAAAGDDVYPCIWLSLQQLKRMGIKYVEMGEQVFYGDEKLVNISKFKRGFGGRTVTKFILTKD